MNASRAIGSLATFPHLSGANAKPTFPQLNLHNTRVRHKPSGFLQVAVSKARNPRRALTVHCRFDWNKAAVYLERINSGDLARRIGWLIDYVKADVPSEARPSAAAGCTEPQDLPRTRSGARAVEGAIGYDETWRVFVNVKREELQGSAGLGRRKAVRKDTQPC
jgi:hypothetical protein